LYVRFIFVIFSLCQILMISLCGKIRQKRVHTTID